MKIRRTQKYEEFELSSLRVEFDEANKNNVFIEFVLCSQTKLDEYEGLLQEKKRFIDSRECNGRNAITFRGVPIIASPLIKDDSMIIVERSVLQEYFGDSSLEYTDELAEKIIADVKRKPIIITTITNPPKNA